MSTSNDSPAAFRLLGITIWDATLEEFLDWWHERLDSDGTTSLGIVNAHSMNLACEQPDFRKALHSMDRVIRDGVGIGVAARIHRRRLLYNFNGTDLFPLIFEETRRPLRVFLYGGTEASNAGASATIGERFPKVEVVGRINGYVDPEAEALPAIRASTADLLLVALGQPRQELFIARHRDELGVKIVAGVGALFDFLSGNVARAPAWVRAARMEWAFRLAMEPRRMFRRYVAGNPKFLARATLDAVRKRSGGSER